MTPDERLEEIYAQVPSIECKGLCHVTCGPIEMSDRERARIAEAGVNMPIYSVPVRFVEPTDCPALTMFKRCGVYEIRPAVCRLWGVSEDMPCTFGCVPERYLSRQETLEILAKADLAGGNSRYKPLSLSRVRRTMSNPRFQAEAELLAQLGIEGDRKKAGL